MSPNQPKNYHELSRLNLNLGNSQTSARPRDEYRSPNTLRHNDFMLSIVPIVAKRFIDHPGY
jgi:hypothetical protein